MIRIDTLSSEKHSENELKQVYDILVKGYETTESEIWGSEYVRIFYPDFLKLVNKKEMLFAKLGEKIAGCIHYFKNTDNTYTFSLLASDFSLGGKGIGTALINKVVAIAKEQEATAIKMEVLRVRGLDVPSKIRLHNFYLKLGFQYTHSLDCACKIPTEKYKKLIAPSDFDFYIKPLQ